MEQYFVTGLGDKELEVCQRRKIGLTSLNVDGREGWVLSDRHLQRLCKITKKCVTFLKSTSYDGIFEATLADQELPADFNPVVTSAGPWNGFSRESFENIARNVLVPALRLPVVFHVPHGYTCPPYRDSSFHVLLWSGTAAKGNRVSTPESMWGISVSYFEDFSLPPDAASRVIRESGNIPVAQIVGRNLYIFHDICHKGTQQDLDIFQRICEEAVALLTKTEEQRKKREKDLWEKLHISSRQLYAEVCKQRVLSAGDSLKKRVTDLTGEVRALSDQLFQKTRELDLTRKALEKFEQNLTITDDMLEKFGEEFDQYFSNKLILGVVVTQDCIEIFTDTLYCEDPRTHILHELGKFKIVIYTSPEQLGNIRAFNMTRTVSGYYSNQHAGHVDNYGRPCFGNAGQIVADLCASRDMFTLANYMIAYLQSVNVDDGAGNWIKSFPVAKIPKKKRRATKARKVAAVA